MLHSRNSRPGKGTPSRHRLRPQAAARLQDPAQFGELGRVLGVMLQPLQEILAAPLLMLLRIDLVRQHLQQAPIALVPHAVDHLRLAQRAQQIGSRRVVERAFADESLACSAVGSPGAVREGLQALIERTAADELVLTAQIFDHAARLKSYALIAEAWWLPRTKTAGLGADA